MVIEQREEEINLFNGQEELVLLHLSDLHLWFSSKILQRLLDMSIKNNPDIILLTGDYFDVPRGAHLFRGFLEQLSKRFTIIFIWGNHDFIYGSRFSKMLLGISNCHCVEDVVYSYVSRRGFSYNFTSWKHRANLPGGISEKNIVLIHNPEKIKENELSNIHLILAGHLHGGQFIFRTLKNNSHFPGNLLYKYCTDRRAIKDTTLIVSKGLGDTFPVRINCPKEIVRIVIR